MEETKIQYILDENGKLVEMPKAEAIPVENPIKYRLKNAFEVFVPVKGTENYWISNYGRCVNNYHKKNFHLHKQGKCHYTIFEIERYPEKKRGRLTGKIVESEWRNETSPEELVAQTFLVKNDRGNRIWHKDGNESNNWYKNLIYVSQKEYLDLKAGKMTWESLDIEQEYIEYENKASAEAYKKYHMIKSRCTGDERAKCYNNVTMCQEWLENPKLFVKWYLEHYYEVDGESMAVDKDLFGNGKMIYSPETCCILPQGINTLLSNCKRHYHVERKENDLPMGIAYNGEKYYGKIQLSSNNDGTKKLSEWNTVEEAFAEYKMIKQADVYVMAVKYKDKIPDYIYKKLLQLDIKPY